MYKREGDRESFASWNINVSGEDNFDVVAAVAPLFRARELTKQSFVVVVVKAVAAARDCERSSADSSFDVILMMYLDNAMMVTEVGECRWQVDVEPAPAGGREVECGFGGRTLI